MSDLNQLTPEQLKELHEQVIEKRKEVLELVDKYNYSANQLVSRTFEHDIERMYGFKVLVTLRGKED